MIPGALFGGLRGVHVPHCRGYRDPRKTNGHERRKLFARVLAEEDTCWICCLPVNKALRGARVANEMTGKRPLHPLSPTLDELEPVSRGGDPLDRTNVKLAHLRCNQWRGDKSVAEVQAYQRTGRILDAIEGRFRMARDHVPSAVGTSRDWSR